MNCEEEKGLCEKYGANAFPTLILFKGDESFKYETERTVEALKTFVIDHAN